MDARRIYAWTNGVSLWRAHWEPWKEITREEGHGVVLHSAFSSCLLSYRKAPYNVEVHGVFNPDAPISPMCFLEELVAGAMDGAVVCPDCLYAETPPMVWVDTEIRTWHRTQDAA